MGWIHEGPDGADLSAHEGRVVALGEDGAALPDRVDWWRYDGEGGRALATAVVAGCSCGWQGATPHPIDWWKRPDETEEGMRVVWEVLHIAPLLEVALPGELSEALTAVDRQLAALADTRPLAALSAVRHLEARGSVTARAAAATARAQGTSWDQIGDALGITRQGAHRRLARHLPHEVPTPTPEEPTARPVAADGATLPELHRAALAVACPACGSAPGQLCTSHSGTRTRTFDVHQARTAAHRSTHTETETTR